MALAAEAGYGIGALPDDLQQRLTASVKYLSHLFLQDSHYERVSEALSKKWARVQSLSAAMKLMEQYGVKLTPEEEERLSQMTESQMIETLVLKMPQQSREQFQHFFLQLQLIVSTATQVRSALESGQPLLVEKALDDADSTGVSQYTMRMAIVQAGLEVSNLQTQHAAWVKDAEAKMARLIHGQQDAVLARDRLEKAKSQLALQKAARSEHIKSVLMSFAGGCASALMHSVMLAWHDHLKEVKQDKAIYEEYRERIERAEQRLIEAKSEQLQTVRAMLEKKISGGKASLLAEVFFAWRDVHQATKKDAANAAEIKALQARIAQVAAEKRERVKGVMEKMAGRADSSLLTFCLHEWMTYSMECKQNQGFEDRVRQAEAEMMRLMKEKSAGARSILTKVASATDSGVLHAAFSTWMEWADAERREHELSKIKKANATKFQGLGARNKKNAINLLESAHENGLSMLYVKVFAAWRLDCRIEQLLRQHGLKIDAKRQQLHGVQRMFRNFAVELETNIRSYQDTDVDNLETLRSIGGQSSAKYKRQLGAYPEHAASLPDIHYQDPRYAYSGAVRSMGQAPPRDSSWR